MPAEEAETPAPGLDHPARIGRVVAVVVVVVVVVVIVLVLVVVVLGPGWIAYFSTGDP